MTGTASLREFVVRSPGPGTVEQWYREALRLEAIDGRFDAGAVSVRIEPGPELPARAREPVRLMPNFVVDDAGEVERSLIAIGATWIRELEATTWGRIATVLDPDGNFVQLFEVPPRDRGGSP